ncbi:MAG: cobalamin-dependent protein [Pirellulales bacterium]|nr:cobalamin-dependent protein [Pirellulales bacterium]
MTLPRRPIRRVLLIYPCTEIDGDNIYGVARDAQGNIVKGDKIEPSLGLGYIASHLRRTLPEVRVEIFDANADAIKMFIADNRVDIPKMWRLVEEEIRRRQPDLVGVSCFSMVTAVSTLKITGIIKRIDPTIHTVIGGNYANTSYDESMAEGNGIDFVAFGEGELVLENLIRTVNAGKDLATVQGIAYRNDLGQIVKNLPQPLIEDVDTIPLPDREHVDMEFYPRQGNYFIYRFLDRATTRVAPVLASRGCRNNCSFCTAKLIWGGQLRYRNPRLVVDEMLYLQERYDINTFTFFDANLLGKPEEFLQLAEELIRRMPGITWASIEGMEVASLTPDVVQAVCESGCKWFVLPFESGNPEVLRAIGKRHNVDDVPGVIESIRAIEGTWISGNLITGFAFETKQDIENSYDYARGLDLDWLYVYRFIPMPGIQMYQECLDAGYTEKYNWGEQADKLFVLNTPHFEAGYVAARNYAFNAEYNFMNNRNVTLNPEQAIRDFDYVLERSLDNPLAMYGKARSYEQMGDLDAAEIWYLRTAEALGTSREKHAPSYDKEDRRMGVVSNSFVVIRRQIEYNQYFEAAGVDVNQHLDRIRRLRQTALKPTG